MGNTSSLMPDDWNSLERVTGLSVPELKALHKEFHIAFPQGKITKREYLQLNSQNKNSEEFVSFMFDSFDKDKNGFIDFREYAIVIGIKKNGSLEDKLKMAFNMFDIDGNGTIEYNEMVKLMTSIYRMTASKNHYEHETILKKMEEHAQDKVDKMFKDMDENKDGVLSFEEFKSGCEKDTEFTKALLKVGNF